MWALFLAAVNFALLIYVSYLCFKRHIDTAVLYYCIVSLYFINIPLLYDALMVLTHGLGPWETTLMSVNRYWTSGTLQNIEIIARDSLVFNISFFFAYYLICGSLIKKKKFDYRPLNRHSLSSLSWGTCFLFAIVGMAMFMIYNNITSFKAMDVGEWYEGRSDSRVLALLASLLVPLMSVGVIRMLYSKNYILGFVLLLPVLTIGFFTGARSQIIPVVFYVLFYFFWRNKNFKLKNILLIGGIVFLLIYILTITREEVTALYPIYKDWAYIDLFYVYDMGSSISTHGLNTATMLLRDFIPQQVEDITSLVADTKFGTGWGTLHPSLLGWAYVDLLDFNWLLAIFFGWIVGLFDRLRHRMPMLIYLLFLSYEFAFLAIAIRGSVKFAYSQLLYPMLLLILLYLLDRFKVIKCHYNENNSNQQGRIGEYTASN